MNATLKSVIQSTIAALDESRFDDAIEKSSAISNDIVQLFELRARAWSKKANSTEELKSALIMIHVAPDYYGGYLRAGKLYAMRGYQDMAMKTLKEGLDNISSSDPNFVMIQQEYERAEARSQIRVDFIVKCPYEVGSCIISHLTYDAIVESVAVSSVWRNKLLEMSSCWKTFTVKHGAKSNRLLPTVSRHIEELKLEDDRWFYKSLDLIQRHEFRKVHSLKIHHNLSQASRGYKPYRDICNVLSTLSKTLTHLYIGQYLVELPCLSAILLMCRNLTNVNLHHSTPNMYWLTGLSLPYTTSLTHLSLTAYYRSSDSNEQIGDLLRCSPALEHLELINYNLDVLPLIVQYCHNLTYFGFDPDDDFGADTIKQQPEHTTKGLQSLILGGPITIRTIRPLLEAHHSTLTTLYISPTEEHPIEDSDWNQLLTYPLPLVSTLCIWEPSDLYTCIPQLIQHCPSLRDIIFNNFDAHGTVEESIRDIAQMKQLESLTLIHCAFDDEVSMAGLLNHCHLRSLTFDQCYFITEEIVMAIGTIENLEDLKIVAHQGDDVGDMTRPLAKLPHLRKIDMRNLAFSDIEVRNLCTIKSLKTAVFYNCLISQAGQRMFEERGITATFIDGSSDSNA